MGSSTSEPSSTRGKRAHGAATSHPSRRVLQASRAKCGSQTAVAARRSSLGGRRPMGEGNRRLSSGVGRRPVRPGRLPAAERYSQAAPEKNSANAEATGFIQGQRHRHGSGRLGRHRASPRASAAPVAARSRSIGKQRLASRQPRGCSSTLIAPKDPQASWSSTPSARS